MKAVRRGIAPNGADSVKRAVCHECDRTWTRDRGYVQADGAPELVATDGGDRF